ncbi:hypothetical protein Celaphus_00012417 [Cervus elaphus hippelaphus]|uniref:Uncharacterized protein n=1 Tax=Cervus elaphus hippelaphus TaxID=46360 RepID=A0A212CK48_CEREH|nr:hypothetical protein Celaphus_00012417 [Cervus elaphus hippelaphus]
MQRSTVQIAPCAARLRAQPAVKYRNMATVLVGIWGHSISSEITYLQHQEGIRKILAMTEQMVIDLKDKEPQLKKVKEKSPYSVQLFESPRFL